MVAGKLLVLPSQPGAGIVNVLLVGREIVEFARCSSCAGSMFCTAKNVIAKMMPQNRITGPPRGLIATAGKWSEMSVIYARIFGQNIESRRETQRGERSKLSRVRKRA